MPSLCVAQQILQHLLKRVDALTTDDPLRSQQRSGRKASTRSSSMGQFNGISRRVECQRMGSWEVPCSKRHQMEFFRLNLPVKRINHHPFLTRELLQHDLA